MTEKKLQPERNLRFKQCDCTHEEAFEVYASMESPSIAKAHKAILRDGLKGRKVEKLSWSTIQRWAREHNWVARSGRVSVEHRIRDQLAIIAAEGRALNAGQIRGLQARLVERLATAISCIAVNTPDDAYRMTEVFEALKQMQQSVREVEVKSGDAASDMRAPPILLGKFQQRAG